MTTPYDLAVAADSPVSYWTLSESSGTAAADGADSNPGTYVGSPTLSQSPPGGGMSASIVLNGTTQAVTIADATNLHMVSPFTVEAWVKTTQAADGHIFHKYGTGANPGFALKSHGSVGAGAGPVGLWVGDNTGGWVYGVRPINDGVWHHVVATLSSGTVSLYVDGVLDQTGARTPSLTTLTAPTIGRDTASNNQYLAGSVSSVAVYNTALSASRVQAHYGAGVTGITSGGCSLAWPVDTRNPVNRQYPLNRGRLAWWLTVPALAGAGKWYDLMGLHPATLFNNTAATGFRGTTRPGGMGHFLMGTAGNPYVQAPWTLAPSGTSRSVALWVKPTALAQRGVASVGGTANDFGSGSPLWLIQLHSGGTWAVYHGGNYRLGTSTVTVNTWYRLVYTFNASTTDVGLYVNGRREFTGSVADSALNNQYLFQASGFPSPLDGGSVDDVSVWNRALPAAEVQQDYDLSRAGYPGAINRLAPATLGVSGGLAGNRRRRVLLCSGG